MAGSVNKVILVGNLGGEPEIKTMPNGGRIARLNVATSESWKDKNSGERQERTEWHRVSVYNDNLVGICERFLHKGSKVYLEGQLETRKWQDKETGQDRYTTEIALRPFRGEITMLDNKGGNAGGGMGGGYQSSESSHTPSSAPAASGAQSWQAPAGNAFEDDIPF